MPLPMVHLCIARRLAERFGYPSSPAFYLGSIAPDAIHQRSGTGRPDKLAVHLVGKDGLDEARLHAFLADHVLETDDGAQTTERTTGYATDIAYGYATDIVIGYLGHVLTDVYWRKAMILPWRAQFEERLQRNIVSVAELRALYYDECDKVDLDLYDLHLWRREVWALLRAARAIDLEGLLSAGEIEGWRDRVLDWFGANKHRALYTPQYMTLERVLPFVDDAAAHVHGRLTARMDSLLL